MKQVESALLDFDSVDRIELTCRSLPDDPALALGQIESPAYLQLLRDSDWAGMYHNVELRTPLVYAHLLSQLQPLLRAFGSYPAKTLLAEAPESALPREVVGRRKTGFGIPVAAQMGATRADSAGAGGRGRGREGAAEAYAGSLP